MSNRLPPLNALKAFEAAGRHLSFTKAANELYVTQAAISHQIKALENFLGIKLFKRKNRMLLLTEEGQSYYLDIKDVLNALHDATQKLLAQGEKGAITVSVQPSLAILWLVPKLSEFHRRYPGIDVRIKADDEKTGNLVEGVDIAFYYGKGPWPSVHAQKIFTEYLLPVCSPALLSTGHGLIEIDDLEQQTLLHDSSRNDWRRWFKSCGKTAKKVEQGPIFSHSALVLQAAIHGQGVALVNNTLAKPELDAGRLVMPFEHVLVNSESYHIVCRKEHIQTPRIAQFIDWVLDTAAQEQFTPEDSE
ncbi:transcriptional regulator GcvA [Thalassotalea ponticola]|uniref:transcriptional regulator GcvA n=1 Tax=Thalassotalea ponticola TaxID=1523392 RepID=UPI0025B422CD|nr:transcriptional regulator GcvA [Thalassotalea ponticola]MDN3651556.1 transcriptional regulator GcvA [Thalassotalea ponticola]